MKNYRKDKMSFWNQLGPVIVSRIEDIVVDVKKDPVKYDAYVTVLDDKADDINNSNEENGGKNEDDNEDRDKYFLTTCILTGVIIILAIGIGVLLCITYRAKADKAYTFEATKL